MNFKKYITICEAIKIQTDRGEAVLSTADGTAAYDFEYEDEKNYSRYSIFTQHSELVGYVGFGNRATHTMIIKADPVNAGADQNFLSNLVKILKSKNFVFTPWKEGDNPMIGVINKVTGDKFDQLDSDYQTVPDTEKGQEHMINLTHGMKVSRQSGSWMIVLQSINIKLILASIEQAAQPLIDNNILLYYRIASRTGNKSDDRFVQSEIGKKTQDNYDTNEKSSIGYLKYILPILLKNHPKLLKRMFWKMDMDYKDIPPSPRKVDISPKNEFVKHLLGDDLITSWAYPIILSVNEEKLNHIEKVLELAEALPQQEQYDFESTCWSLAEYPEDLPRYMEDLDNPEKALYATMEDNIARLVIYSDKFKQLGYESTIDEIEQKLKNVLPSLIAREAGTIASMPHYLNNFIKMAEKFGLTHELEILTQAQTKREQKLTPKKKRR